MRSTRARPWRMECAARPRILARVMVPDGAFARLFQEWIS